MTMMEVEVVIHLHLHQEVTMTMLIRVLRRQELRYEKIKLSQKIPYFTLKVKILATA